MNPELLKRVQLFEGLSDPELAEILMLGAVKEYAKDDVIFEEGAPGDCFYVIYAGAVRISKMFENMGEEALTCVRSWGFSGRDVFFRRRATLRARGRSRRRQASRDPQPNAQRTSRATARCSAEVPLGLRSNVVAEGPRHQQESFRPCSQFPAFFRRFSSLKPQVTPEANPLGPWALATYLVNDGRNPP